MHFLSSKCIHTNLCCFRPLSCSSTLLKGTLAVTFELVLDSGDHSYSHKLLCHCVALVQGGRAGGYWPLSPCLKMATTLRASGCEWEHGT